MIRKLVMPYKLANSNNFQAQAKLIHDWLEKYPKMNTQPFNPDLGDDESDNDDLFADNADTEVMTDEDATEEDATEEDATEKDSTEEDSTEEDSTEENAINEVETDELESDKNTPDDNLTHNEQPLQIAPLSPIEPITPIQPLQQFGSQPDILSNLYRMQHGDNNQVQQPNLLVAMSGRPGRELYEAYRNSYMPQPPSVNSNAIGRQPNHPPSHWVQPPASNSNPVLNQKTNAAKPSPQLPASNSNPVLNQKTNATKPSTQPPASNANPVLNQKNNATKPSTQPPAHISIPYTKEEKLKIKKEIAESRSELTPNGNSLHLKGKNSPKGSVETVKPDTTGGEWPMKALHEKSLNFVDILGVDHLMITGGWEKRDEPSLHITGKAVDFGFGRTMNQALNPDSPKFLGWSKIEKAFAAAYGNGYKVGLEGNHFHVQVNTQGPNSPTQFYFHKNKEGKNIYKGLNPPDRKKWP